MNLRSTASALIEAALQSAQPDEAVKRALAAHPLHGDVYLVAIGKAAWQMARAAVGCLPVKDGVVITKYGHAAGDLPGVRIFEAAHPVPDANSYRATQAAINLVASLRAEDTVLFLVSGGGSALFEKPLVPDEEMADITRQLLACGADIQEINTLRKRLSAVKGGKFGDYASLRASFPSYSPTSSAIRWI